MMTSGSAPGNNGFPDSARASTKLFIGGLSRVCEFQISSAAANEKLKPEF
jgi:hypothetical protein